MTNTPKLAERAKRKHRYFLLNCDEYHQHRDSCYVEVSREVFIANGGKVRGKR